MNDVIFEQDKPLQQPYTAKALLNMAKNPLLAYPLPKVDPGNWLCNLLRRQRLTKAQIIEKVGKDLWLTLEKRDGVFVFRFPDIWDTDDIQDMQRRVLDGIAMLEDQFSLIVWIKERPIISLILEIVCFFGSFFCYAALTGKSASGLIFLGMAAIWVIWTALFSIAFTSFCWLGEPRVVSFYFGPSDDDEEPPYGLGGYIAKTEAANPIERAAIDDWIAMTGKINEPPYGGPSNSAFLALVRAIDERLSCHEEPLKSDKLYEEPQAIYPMEMEQD